MSVYTGEEKTVISRATAEANIDETMRGRHVDFDSTYFSQRAVGDLLQVTGAVGIRLYMGKVLEDGKTYKTLIAVAVDEDGNDLTEGGEVILGDKPCPIYCNGDGMWP